MTVPLAPWVTEVTTGVPSNESFVSRAPAPVVEAARAREAELADQVDKLRDRLER